MSYIEFSSPDRSVRVSGRERASLSVYCGDWLFMQLGIGIYSEVTAFIKEALPQGYAANNALKDFASLKTHCGVGQEFSLGSEKVNVFTLALNSVLTDGNRAAQLAAKLHGQCEIHGYIEGPDRSWLAEIIDEGLEAGIFRRHQGWEIGKRDAPGWEAVSTLLREDERHPVVTSYSVTDTFPGPHLASADWLHDPEDPWEAWSELTESERWAMAIATIRADPGLQISPARLGVKFGDGMNGREFAAAIRERIASAETQKVQAPADA